MFHEGDLVRIKPQYVDNRCSYGSYYQAWEGRIVRRNSDNIGWIVNFGDGIHYSYGGFSCEPHVLELVNPPTEDDTVSDEPMVTCEWCHEDYPESHMHSITSTRWGSITIILCESCRDNTAYCTWCDELCNREDLTYDDAGSRICPTCQEDAIMCENCGRWTSEWDEYDHCPECQDNDTSLIHDYHSSHYHDRNFLPSYKEEGLFLGVELEIESLNTSYISLAEKLRSFDPNETYFTMEDDSSLCSGFEIISEPATLGYHKQKFMWAKILKACRDAEARSHNGGRCGLHVHFSSNFYGRNIDEREQHEAKLLYLVEKFWEHFAKISRRSEDSLQTWACRYTHASRLHLSPKEICAGAKAHHTAVNLENSNTVEIRLFRGTLKDTTFLATLELVDFLARFTKRHTIRYLQELTWETMIKKIGKQKYPNLINYLKEISLYVYNNS